MKLWQVILAFSGVIFLLAGTLAFSGKRRIGYSLPFYFFLLIHLAGIAGIMALTGNNTDWWTLGYFLLYLYFAYLPLIWYILGSHWGRDTKDLSRLSTILAAAALAFSTILMTYLWAERPLDIVQQDNQWSLDLAGSSRWFLGLHAFYLTAGLYLVENCYRSSLGLAREKIKKSFFPLLAFAVGLLALTTEGMMYGRISSLMLVLMFFLAAIVSLPLARHCRYFSPKDDGIILTNKGIYSSLAVVLIGIYFFIIGIVGELLIKYKLDEGLFISVVVLILVVGTFVLVLVSQTIRSRFRIVPGGATAIRGKNPYAAEWKEFAEEVSVTLSIDAIYEHTARLLHRLLRIDRCFFIIREPAPSENYTLYAGEGCDRGIPGDQVALLCDWLYRFGHPVETATLKEKSPRETAELEHLEKTLPYQVFLLVPFIARQQFLGFWGIGRHDGKSELTSDEISFIEAAASPVALTIMGARMTDELLVSREIDSYHKFSSFVLHDLKNSVAMLSMLMQNAEKNINNPEFQKAALVTIGKAVDRQKKIISRLTEEKTPDKLSLHKVDLEQLIRTALERVRLDTIPTIKINLNVPEKSMAIVDPEKVGSVFDNLLMNAIEAMPGGGSLTIALIDSDLPGFVALSFKDSGIGMEPEFISTRLFKPFSSTKQYGLGIGMYQSREIIQAHQGKIEVKSTPGLGSEFIIYLPGEK
jgi:putative PEP-CTERM system histidine kinase